MKRGVVVDNHPEVWGPDQAGKHQTSLENEARQAAGIRRWAAERRSVGFDDSRSFELQRGEETESMAASRVRCNIEIGGAHGLDRGQLRWRWRISGCNSAVWRM
jgi:hypothetical protein